MFLIYLLVYIPERSWQVVAHVTSHLGDEYVILLICIYTPGGSYQHTGTPVTSSTHTNVFIIARVVITVAVFYYESQLWQLDNVVRK